MSLFPSRLKPGGTLTIHLRSQSISPVWVRKKVFIVNPEGKRQLCFDRLQPFIPPPRSEDDLVLMRRSREVYQAPPLPMAAHYLQNESRNVEFFVEALRGLKDATHHYTTYTLPSDAPLGRYRVELEASAKGETRGSRTAATDYFFVEKLFLREVLSKGGEREAHVENPSPEPVLANLCELTPGEKGQERFRSRLLSLPAKSTSPISFEGVAFLMYLEGTELLHLTTEDDPFCVREPALLSLPKGNVIYVFRAHEAPEAGYKLESQAAAIWDQAQGFRLRSQIRNESNHEGYDQMLKEGLILEIHH